jgi:hypothetical protein
MSFKNRVSGSEAVPNPPGPFTLAANWEDVPFVVEGW